MKIKNYLVLIIFLACLTSSLILSIKQTPPICEEGCDVVQTSKYAQTFGIKNSVYGIFIFAFLSLITFLQIKNPDKIKKNIITTGIILGSLVAIYFIYLQIFVIKAYCKYCLIVDIGLIISIPINFLVKK